MGPRRSSQEDHRPRHQQDHRVPLHADGNRLIERDGTDGPSGSVTMYLGTAEITVKDGVRSTVRTYTLDDVPVATRDKNGIQLIGANHQNMPTGVLHGQVTS